MRLVTQGFHNSKWVQSVLNCYLPLYLSMDHLTVLLHVLLYKNTETTQQMQNLAKEA